MFSPKLPAFLKDLHFVSKGGMAPSAACHLSLFSCCNSHLLTPSGRLCVLSTNYMFWYLGQDQDLEHILEK